MADLALVGAVRVHDPNLPVAGAIGYEIDFGAEQRWAAHLCSAPKSISYPIAPATGRFGSWTRTAPTSARSAISIRYPSCPASRPTVQKSSLLATLAGILLYLYSRRIRGGACRFIIKSHP